MARSRQEICKKGHRLESDNVYVAPNGVRQCIACRRQTHSRYRSTPKGKIAAKSRDIREAGWTLERYEQCLASQDGKCAICKREFDKMDKSPACDHCHVTNTPRELLCNDCNSGIGFLKENLSIIEAAKEYVSKWKGGHLVRSL